MNRINHSTTSIAGAAAAKAKANNNSENVKKNETLVQESGPEQSLRRRALAHEYGYNPPSGHIHPATSTVMFGNYGTTTMDTHSFIAAPTSRLHHQYNQRHHRCNPNGFLLSNNDTSLDFNLLASGDDKEEKALSFEPLFSLQCHHRQEPSLIPTQQQPSSFSFQVGAGAVTAGVGVGGSSLFSSSSSLMVPSSPITVPSMISGSSQNIFDYNRNNNTVNNKSNAALLLTAKTKPNQLLGEIMSTTTTAATTASATRVSGKKGPKPTKKKGKPVKPVVGKGVGKQRKERQKWTTEVSFEN